MKYSHSFVLSCAAALLSTSAAYAHDGISAGFGHSGFEASADDHAPIGVMGDHMHKEGEWMVSYRFMRMEMKDNRDGTDDLSPEEIVTNYDNRFSSVAMQPAKLRVVPTEMSMDMHMFGAMYAPSDWLTLMAMVNYVEKEMDHLTFQGMMGTNVLGGFTTETSGFGDTKLSGLIRLYHDPVHHVHLNAGLSLPTGSIDEEDDVLTPMNTRPTQRLPYAMQLGTGTYDLHPGITYFGQMNDWGWGIQGRAEIRLEDENDEGYAWGDKYALTGWGSYQWAPWISTSLRLSASTQNAIDGIDPQIVAPVQTADPHNFGGEIIEAGFGLNLLGLGGYIKDHRLAFEVTAPLYQDLNGPQMERDYGVMIGWQYAF